LRRIVLSRKMAISFCTCHPERLAAVTSPVIRRDYGPHQMADYLGAFYGQVDRARLFGLLPAPDRGGGKRWSAEAVEEIRGRWAEIAAATECIGAYGLKERGWTGSMIRDFLGKPDLTVDNPHCKKSGAWRLWRLQRAEAAEATPEFAARKARATGQCASAAKAAETRKLWKALGGAR
jgi:hypothetical protein